LSASWMNMIIFSIPESMVIFFLASSLAAKKIKPAWLIIMGITLGIGGNLIRNVTGSFILNICCASLLAILLIKFLGSFSLFEAITSGITSISLYLAVEFLNVKSLQVLTGMAPTLMENDLGLRVLWFLPQLTAAGGLSLFIRYILSRQNQLELNANSNANKPNGDHPYEDQHL